MSSFYSDLIDYFTSPLSEEESKKLKEIREKEAKKDFWFNILIIYPLVILITLFIVSLFFLMGRLSTLWF